MTSEQEDIKENNTFLDGILWAIIKLRELGPRDKSKWSHSRDLDFAPVELSDYLLIEAKKAQIIKRHTNDN